MSQNPIQNKLAYFSQGATYRTKKTEGDLSNRSIAFVGDDMSIATQGKIFGVRGVYPGICGNDQAALTTKVITTSPPFPIDTNGRPLVGTTIAVYFAETDTSTAKPYLNVNGTGEYAIQYGAGTIASKASTSYTGYAGNYIYYWFDWDDSRETDKGRWVWLNRSTFQSNTDVEPGRLYGTAYKTGSVALYRNTLAGMTSGGYIESIVTSSSTGKTKTRNTHGFRLGQWYYNSSTTATSVAANTNITSNILWLWYTSAYVDCQYSFNSGKTLTGHLPIYLVGTVNSNDNLFYLDATWWTQTLPSTEDGKVYVDIGVAYDTYRFIFNGGMNAWEYKDGALRPYSYHRPAATVNDGTLTIKQNGNSRGTFTANQAGNSEADIISIVYGKYTSDGFKQGFPNLNNGWSYLSSPIELETGVLYIDVTTKKVYYYSGLGSTTTGLQEIFSPDLTTYENVQADWDETDNTSDAYIWNKPTIPTVGTLNTNNSTTQTVNSSESFSSDISLHKVSKTGSYNDLLNKPTIPTIPDHKTLDGVSLVGSTGNVDKIVFGKLNANGSFTRHEKVGNEWAMVDVLTSPAARILYVDVFTGLSYYYDTVVSQYKLIGPNPDLSGFLTSETQLSVNGTVTGNGNAVTDISVSGHQITLTKGTTFLTASDITGKADKSAAIGSLSLSLNTTDYKITLTGTYVDGTPFTVSDVIDLPLESVVVSGSYDPSTKKVVLTLKNNSTIEFSIADLISGLQSEITSNNKLSADLVENGTTNKVYTATEQTKLSGIEAGAEVNVQPDWNQTNTSADDYVKNKPTLDGVTITGALSKIVYGKKDSNGFVKGTRNNNGQGFSWFANNVTPEEHVLYIDITNYKGWYYEGGSYRQLHELNLSPYENVQADWNETDDSSDAYIWNKPTIPSAIEIIDLT